VIVASMTCKAATHEDLQQIAECHASAFPESLSTAMGRKYLEKMLSWYLASEDTFLFYIAEKDKVVGYCGGMIVDTSRRMGSASSMAQYSFNEAVIAFLLRPWLVFHKEVIVKYRFIFRNLVKRFIKTASPKINSGQSARTIPADRYSALVVIGVRKNLQGGGYGSKLLAEFENQSHLRGLSKMLLTVRTDNRQAIKAYEKNGWLKTESNRKSTTMRKTINP
jgi:ribosomal protein S18 acetylase RimI-like enzyme